MRDKSTLRRRVTRLVAGITLALIGWLLLVIIVIWWIVRCVRGLNSLANGEPPSNLTTWGF